MQAIRHKNMRIRAGAWVCLVVLAGAVLCHGQEQGQVDRSLKILYAGRPGSAREKDFVRFLKQPFDVVQTGNLQTFNESDTRGFDVMLLDWDKGAHEGPYPRASARFSRPVITLGVYGAKICSQWRLKTGYL